MLAPVEVPVRCRKQHDALERAARSRLLSGLILATDAQHPPQKAPASWYFRTLRFLP